MSSTFECCGFDADANSNNFADNLSFLATSTGPKTFRLKFALFAFFVLDRRPLAIWSCCRKLDKAGSPTATDRISL